MLDFEMSFEIKTMFDEMLDDAYPVVEIGYLKSACRLDKS